MVSTDRVQRRVQKVRDSLKHLLALSKDSSSFSSADLIGLIFDDDLITWFHTNHPGELKNIATALFTRHAAAFMRHAAQQGLNISVNPPSPPPQFPPAFLE